ncbi:AAA family ATPase [Candidatus Gracilibacteria bacterium]|nr:AAA family ATPase [Candidatus Gracilibacteria bacterium]
MKINKLIIENFKTFSTKEEFDFNCNLIFLVGENNTGKTTVLEAIAYLIEGPDKDKKYKNSKCSENDEITIEAEIMCDPASLVGDLKKYEDYVINGDKLHIKRSTKKETVSQKGKDVSLDESKIQIYNPTTLQFENPTGKDTTFRSLFEPVFIWSDVTPKDVIDFGSTKILGKLVSSYARDFFSSPLYKDFEAQRHRVFQEDENSLAKKLENLGTEITTVFNDQYGDAKIEFNFGAIDAGSYTKTGKLVIDENDDREELAYKGSGMQRSIALSVIQLFSNISSSTDTGKIILCIDEPELSLHPIAQEKLIQSLLKLSQNVQIFITTHSPNILKNFKSAHNKLYIFSKKSPRFKLIDELGLIKWGPTLSEVNYFAYNLYSKELFSDLYAYLEYLVIDQNLAENGEKYLRDTKGKNQVSYVKLKNDGTTSNEQWTELSIMRHKIHHQENRHNSELTEQELIQGIEELVSFVRELV